MPVFDVTVDGKTYHVEIPDPGATPLQVIVDGQAFDVGIVGTQARIAPVELAPPPPPVSEPTHLPAPRAVAVTRPVAPAGSETPGEVIAPMPGTILSVAVSPGDMVEPGSVLCTLEAMKMKNPIRATQHATVVEVAVQPGQNVAYGDLLVRLT